MRGSIEKQVGERLRKLRNDAGLSQEELARLANVHRTFIGSIERGEKSITVKTAYKICNALGVSLSDLFKGF